MSLPRYSGTIIFVLISNIGLLLLAIYLSKQTGIRAAYFYRDPNGVAQQSFYIGFLSNLGIVGWIAAASIALFTCSIERAWGYRHKGFSTLFLLGLLTWWLGADDLFMLHDGLFEQIGIPQPPVVLVEALLGLVWAVSAVRSTSSFYRDHLLMILAFACLGASLVLDQVSDAEVFSFSGLSLLEDAAKLTGITFWAVYAIRFSFKRLMHLKNLREQA